MRYGRLSDLGCDPYANKPIYLPLSPSALPACVCDVMYAANVLQRDKEKFNKNIIP